MLGKAKDALKGNSGGSSGGSGSGQPSGVEKAVDKQAHTGMLSRFYARSCAS
jgi:hypothetical protein